jgi:integrase
MTTRRAFGNIRTTRAGRYIPRYRDRQTGQWVNGPRCEFKADADVWLAQQQADLSRGIGRSDPRSLPTLLVYATEWLEHRDLAPRTRQLYSDLLRLWIVPQLGASRLDQIDAPAVRAWHHALGTATGPQRRRQAYSLLRTIFNSALDDELIRFNPCRIRGAGSVQSPERPYMSPQDVQKIADCAEPHMVPVITVAFWGALRLGELLALTRADVDLSAGMLRINKAEGRVDGRSTIGPPKTKSSIRTVSLPEPALAVLREVTKGQLPAAPLFTFKDGRPITRRQVRAGWIKARAAAGLEHFHLHDCRHAGLTLSSQLGATQRDVMQRAGHSSTRAAAIYQHTSAKQDKQIADLLSQFAAAAAAQVGEAVERGLV